MQHRPHRQRPRTLHRPATTSSPFCSSCSTWKQFFLFPWAVRFKALGLFSLFEILSLPRDPDRRIQKGLEKRRPRMGATGVVEDRTFVEERPSVEGGMKAALRSKFSGLQPLWSLIAAGVGQKNVHSPQPDRPNPPPKLSPPVAGRGKFFLPHQNNSSAPPRVITPPNRASSAATKFFSFCRGSPRFTSRPA